MIIDPLSFYGLFSKKKFINFNEIYENLEEKYKEYYEVIWYFFNYFYLDIHFSTFIYIQNSFWGYYLLIQESLKVFVMQPKKKWKKKE